MDLIGKEILNYRITKFIGQGGMGSVYEAENRDINQRVAVKVLNETFSQNPEIRERFKREAETLLRFNHPNIVKLINFLVQDDGVYLIMEMAEGMSLENFIHKKNGLIVEEKAYPIMCEILEAFSYAHKKGIVHRDIKPSNIFINDEGHVKVLDFGIATIINGEDTDKGWVMGTPSYMSPEQVNAEAIDQRSDIYSLGVLFHSMLTGCEPYDENTMTEQRIMDAVVKSPLARMKEYYPYISDGMQRVVDKATEKDPKNRFQNCEQFLKAVKKVLDPEPLSKRIIGIAAVLLLAIVAGGLWLWDYNRTKVVYYKDYVEQWGIPQGIHELSETEQMHRDKTYRMEFCRGHLQRLSLVNAKGNLTKHTDSEHTERWTDARFWYTENGNIDYMKVYDASGRVLYIFDYDESLTSATFKLDDGKGTEMFLAANTNELFASATQGFSFTKSRIMKYELEYDDHGYVLKTLYEGFRSTRVCDSQGIWGKSYKRDAKGRVVEECFLGQNGEFKALKNGLGLKRFVYDTNDNWTEVRYFTLDEGPGDDGNGCPVVIISYDEWGNRKCERYYTFEGTPSIRKDVVAHGFTYSYNDQGELVKCMYLGIDGQVSACGNGNYGRIQKWDENGYLSQVSYIDADGNLYDVYDESEGKLWSTMVMKNDSVGNILEVAYLKSDGTPAELEFPVIRYTYDDLGRQIRKQGCDASGNPIENVQGYSTEEIVWNELSQIVALRYLDKQGALTNTLNGYAIEGREYDIHGNLVKMTCLDTLEQLVNSFEGYAILTYSFDNSGNLTEMAYYDKENHLVETEGSWAKQISTYDDHGNRLSFRWYDKNDKLMFINDKCGGDYTYDNRGNITMGFPVGKDSKLAKGYFILTYAYDNLGRETEMSYWTGSKDNLKPATSGGYHKVTYQYNNQNKVIEEAYYDEKGNPVNSKGTHYASVHSVYDLRGNVVEKKYYDANQQKGYDENKVYRYVYEYDAQVNKRSHQISFDVNDKPIASGDNVAPEAFVKYDSRGNHIEIMCADGYGNAINGTKKWCYSRYTYDKNNNVTEKAWYDKDNHLVMTDDGYAILRQKYDSQNRATEIAIFDDKDKPTGATIHRIVLVYDGTSREPKSRVYYDKNGKKVDLNKQSAPAIEGGSQGTRESWQASFEEFKKTQLPFKVADNLYCTNLTYTSTSLTIYYSISNIDMSLLSEDTQNSVRSQIASLLPNAKTAAKASFGKLMPSSVDLFIVLTDNKGVEIVRG